MEPPGHTRRAGEEAHRRPASGGGLTAGLPDPVKRSLASLAGKRVLHVQCGTGDATLELAALGAVVTGVDPSEAALDAARERMPSIVWVHADSAALPAELRRSRFDLVYAGEGVLAEVGDLGAFAAGIPAAPRPRADLLLYEEHPGAPFVDAVMRRRQDHF